MRTSLLRCTLLSAAIASVLGSPANANNWNGSYIANGQCFCIGVQDSAVSNQLLPTPVGGQSVSQICERVGNGPGLTMNDGVFDSPVYADPQCGHGPFANNQKPDIGCSGAYEPGVDCQAAGPTWDLQLAFKEELNKEAEPSTTIAVTGGSRYIDPASFRVDESTDQQTAALSANEEQVLNAEGAETQNLTSSVERVMVIDGVEVTVSEDVPQPQVIVATESVDKERAEAARLAELDRIKELAKQARLDADAKLAEQTSVDADVKLAEQARLDTEANLAEQTRVDADAKLAEQARLDTETNLAKQARVDAEAKQAEQARIDAEAKLAEQARIDAEAKLAEQARIDAEAKLAEQARSDADTAEVVAESTGGDAKIAPIAALQLPSGIESKYNDFEYLQAMPLGYDYGGGGMAVSGSYASHGKWHYLGRAGVADSYSELFIGAGYYFVPPKATRMTLSATVGLEYGRFTLTSGDLSARDEDSGLALNIASRFVLNRHVELQAGLGYSSFFDGDVHFIGGGFVHINKQLDLTSQFELGDNDSFGLGIRYYY